MSQTEPAHTRGAIIADLACVVAEISDIQIEHAKLTERTAVLQSRLTRMIRDLSCTTSLQVPPGTDLQKLRERCGAVRGRLQATASDLRNSAERISPAAQAAPPSDLSPAAQSEGRPDDARRALDAVLERETGKGHTSDQSREFVTSAGAGEAPASAIDPASAADAPRVPRREPEVRNTGGGLVQDGGSLKPTAAVEKAPLVRDVILDAYATTTKTIAEIAEHSGSTRDSVKVTLNKARHREEPRVRAGDDLRAPKKEPTLAPVAQPTAREIADAAKPVAEIPAPRPIPTGGIEIPAGKLIAVRGSEVHGPTGIWRTSKETAKAFSMLADGQLYGLETMARHGGLTSAVCVGLIGMWTAALAKIGIELHHHKGYGLRLRAIGGQA